MFPGNLFHGDDVLPEPPLRALKAGAGAEIDVLIGSNAEEMNLYLVPTGVRDKLGALGYDVRWHTYPMPHSVSAQEVFDISAFLRSVMR